MSTSQDPVGGRNRLLFVGTVSVLGLVTLTLLFGVTARLFVFLGARGQDTLGVAVLVLALAVMVYLGYRWLALVVTGLYRQDYWVAYQELGQPELGQLRFALTGKRSALGSVPHEEVVAHIAGTDDCRDLEAAFERSERFGNVRTGGFLYGE